MRLDLHIETLGDATQMVHISADMSAVEFAVTVCQLVRFMADKTEVSETEIWTMIEAERQHPSFEMMVGPRVN